MYTTYSISIGVCRVSWSNAKSHYENVCCIFFILYLLSRNMHVNGVDDLILYVASSPDEVCTDRIALCRAILYFYKPLILLGKSLSRKERFRYAFGFMHWCKSISRFYFYRVAGACMRLRSCRICCESRLDCQDLFSSFL